MCSIASGSVSAVSNTRLADALSCLLHGEHFRILRDFIDREGLGLATSHAGRTLGHTGQGDTFDLWAFAEQFIDSAHRNMTLNDIAANRRGMASGKLLRHAVLTADLRQIRRWLHRDNKPMLTQVLGIVLATATTRSLVHDRANRLSARCADTEQKHEDK